MDNSNPLKTILDCYKKIIAVDKDKIAGWVINQEVISENPMVKIGISEPVYRGKEYSLKDMGPAADGIINMNDAGTKGKEQSLTGESFYVKVGDATSVSASPDGFSNDSITSASIPLSEDEDKKGVGAEPEKESVPSDMYAETQESFKEELLDARLVFYSKLRDYGASWRIFRPVSVTDQLVIKAVRIRNLEDVGVSYVGEGIYPEFQAIVNYGIVALIQSRFGAAIDIDMSADEAMECYDKIMYETFDLMCRKNADYHEAWRLMRVSSYTDFILVKLARIKQIEENGGHTTVSEGIDANYMDIINYAVFGLIKLSEEKSKNAGESHDK